MAEFSQTQPNPVGDGEAFNSLHMLQGVGFILSVLENQSEH